MMRRIQYIILSVALLSSLLMAGCQLTIKEETPAPVTGGTALNLYGIDPHTLDPAISAEMTSHQYIMQLFGGLVRFDAHLEPAPDIAQRWEVSDDGKTYTFYLRRGVSFQMVERSEPKILSIPGSVPPTRLPAR